MEHDKLDSMSETELRIYLRSVLHTIRDLYYGAGDDGEYNYYWVRARCGAASELLCPHCVDMGEHTHKLVNGDVYYHPIRKT